MSVHTQGFKELFSLLHFLEQRERAGGMGGVTARFTSSTLIMKLRLIKSRGKFGVYKQ